MYIFNIIQLKAFIDGDRLEGIMYRSHNKKSLPCINAGLICNMH